MILHITRAEYRNDFRIHVWFNDGSDGEVDFEPHLTGPIFAPLHDKAYFAQFKLEGHTVAWDNGADFAPEYVHELIQSAAAA